MATHLPLVILEEEGTVLMRGHFSKVNTHWLHLEGESVLVVFSEPHAYVSPSLYSNPQNVPTWNYMAVHAYGSIRLVSGDEKRRFMEEMIQHLEPAYRAQWDGLSEKYVTGMLDGIVAFEMIVTDLQGKWKLSQNKPEKDRKNVSDHLMASEDSVIRKIGEEMQARD